MNEVEKTYISPLLGVDGKIKIPTYAKQVKIDVGLSYSAPNSKKWIKHTEDRHIFSFEPQKQLNPFDLGPKSKSLREPVVFGDRYTYLKCGLDDLEEGCVKDMYISGEDVGRSSIYKPLWNNFQFKGMQEVDLIPFKLFLEHFPWDRFEFIEQLKTDTQGNDLRILQNAGDYIERFAYIDVESTCYFDSDGVGEYEYFPSKEETMNYLYSRGFEVIKIANEIDQTYFNFKKI